MIVFYAHSIFMRPTTPVPLDVHCAARPVVFTRCIIQGYS